jgi:hypothetical protein
MKNKPHIALNKQQEEAITVFSQVLQNSNIKLENLLFHIAKID